MIPLTSALIIIVTHFIGDFICQSNWMATNKSKRMDALTAHVAAYTFILFIGGIFAISESGSMPHDGGEAFTVIVGFAAINGLLHFGVDFFTSKAAAYHYEDNRSLFFKIIGADQMLHMVCLFATLNYFLG